MWFQMPPEQLFFSFFMEKEMFRLVVIPLIVPLYVCVCVCVALHMHVYMHVCMYVKL